jgi:hypothetical protein
VRDDMLVYDVAESSLKQVSESPLWGRPLCCRAANSPLRTMQLLHAMPETFDESALGNPEHNWSALWGMAKGSGWWHRYAGRRRWV